MTTTTLLTFLGASLAVTIAPGPDNLCVLTLGITRGRRPAIVTALGMCSGISVHTLAAAGISALCYSSALAFGAVKYAGAAYLLYLAWRTLRAPTGLALTAVADSKSTAALFRQGFAMNVLNPKVALFFLAFLPQFVTPAGGAVAVQMLLLGGVFMAQAVVVFCLLGYCSGSLGNRLLTRPRLVRALDWLTAGVFVALGLRLALVER